MAYSRPMLIFYIIVIYKIYITIICINVYGLGLYIIIGPTIYISIYIFRPI